MSAFAFALALLGSVTAAVASTPWRFTDVTEPAGVYYVHGYTPEVQIDQGEIQAGGVAAGDYDRDGFVDLYVARGNAGPNLLFRNRGDGTFEERGTAAGVDLHGEVGTGAFFADLDGDGWLDLLVVGLVCPPKVAYCEVGSGQRSPPRLFHNRGDGTFADVSASSGLALTSDSYSAAAGDYDRDGDLDLFITHWFADGSRPLGPSEQLWRNDGDGAFTDVTEASGINAAYVFPEANGIFLLNFTANFADVDSDGWPDLLIAGDFSTSKIFHNNGDGTFTNATTRVISDENGMGAAVGDYDNDGDLDWFVSSIWDPNQIPEGNWLISGNRLYRNRGDGTFDDVTGAAGVRDGYWGWGSTFADFDNDGGLDLFHVNGWRLDDPDAFEFHQDPSRLFVNDGDGTFTERSAALGAADTGNGRGVVAFDYDRDGDLDLFISNNQQPTRLLRNDGGNTRRYLNVTLRGQAPNTEAIGARVYVVAGGRTQMRELRAGSNFQSQDPAEAHFGLGDSASAEAVGILWPDGSASMRHEVAANQQLRFDQPDRHGCTAAATRSSCVPGGGRNGRTECYLEWQTRPAPEIAPNSGARNHLRCLDGQPACDLDGDATNGRCTLQLRLCLNNHDPRFRYCAPADVASVDLRFPRRGGSDPVDLAIRAAVDDAARRLGVPLRGAGASLTSGAPVVTTDVCSPPFDVVVPPGRRTIRTIAISSSGGRDPDSLTLECATVVE